MSEQEIRPPEGLGNDYLSGIIKSLLSTADAEAEAPISDTAQKGASETVPATSSAEGLPTGGQADLFSSLLSDPRLLSKLPALLSMAKPILELMTTQNRHEVATSPQAAEKMPATASVPTSAPHPTGEQRRSGDPTDRRAALLCAMKPYLSHDRQNAIDYIIKLSRLGDILKSL